ncbi:MAG: hypothetical protein LBG17_00215 [Bacteroidales bacterium]|jgi:hypothetical protein|nr:hypothetical protein [Bacteroidales bacterium]
MKNLMKLNGRKFTAKWYNAEYGGYMDISGVISVEHDNSYYRIPGVYLCTDVIRDLPCRSKKGYRYAHYVAAGEPAHLEICKITNLKVCN